MPTTLLSNSMSYTMNKFEHFQGKGVFVQWGPTWTNLNMSRGLGPCTGSAGAGALYGVTPSHMNAWTDRQTHDWKHKVRHSISGR